MFGKGGAIAFAVLDIAWLHLDGLGSEGGSTTIVGNYRKGLGTGCIKCSYKLVVAAGELEATKSRKGEFYGAICIGEDSELRGLTNVGLFKWFNAGDDELDVGVTSFKPGGLIVGAAAQPP